MDAERPTVSAAISDEEGHFEVSTYELGDGAPEGAYTLTFQWRAYDAFSGSYDRPDAFKGRFSRPGTVEVRFTVEKGKAIDLGEIRLRSP
jgi:hypothetical protein